jgi:outer membrane protein
MNARSLIAGLLFASIVCGQTPLEVEKPHAPVIIRPYKGASVPPVRLANSDRLRSLVRAGRIYLTAQDAIALAIENNLDLEVERYSSVLAEWGVQRADAGGLLRGVPNGSAQVGQVASGQGVVGSQRSAGVSSNTGGSATVSGNAIVSQIGPVTANLDPVLQNSTVFSHTTIPQSNTVQSQTNALVENTRIYSTSIQQGFLSGGYVQLSGNNSYLNENAPTDVLNPSVAPRLSIYMQHSLLQGFGTKVNSRFIKVAENNLQASRETFRSRLINVVADVLNLYWDLAADQDDLQARVRDREIAQKFYEDTKRQISIGTLARVDILRAESQFAAAQEQAVQAETAELLQQNLLKNALSRNGLAESPLADLPLVAIDRLQVPDTENLPPFRTLINHALANRPDIVATRINTKSSELSAIGTENGLLPSLQGIVSATNSGLSGTANPQPDGTTANAYFIGGLGNGIGQVFRRNFPNQRAAILLQPVPVGVDHIDQADYAIDQLQVRQAELSQQRAMNQVAVEVSNQVVALRQARARYVAAAKTRTVQQELFDAEKKRFELAASTIGAVVAAQQGLAVSQSAESAARTTYIHARVSLDEVLGDTLTANNVSLEDGIRGKVGN